MSNEPVQEDTRRRSRTGPVGRAVRLLLAAWLSWVGVELWTDRTLIFAGTDPVHDPSLWFMTALLVFGLYELANLGGWGVRSLVVLAVAAAATAVTALVTAGTVWTDPLTWLVWGFDIVGIGFVVLALLLAAVVGTPGCEIGVFRDLARRWRGEPDDDKPLFCVVGLRALDAWERRQPWYPSR